MDRTAFGYFFLLFFFILAFHAFGKTSDKIPFHGAQKTGTIVDPELDEISGIFASRKNKGVLWAVNDSGNAPVLYAVSLGGKRIASYAVEGVQNIDWEDLSGFTYKGEDFLVIGDVGDNKARRKSCSLYGVKEPVVPGPGVKGSLPVHWRMRFRYADGPRDCEAVAVDQNSRRIFLLSKRERYPSLYELPLIFSPEETLYTAAPVARIRTIPQPSAADLGERYGKYRSRPTSMDISSGGKALVILTYKHAYRFLRKQAQTWDKAVESPPELLQLPLPDTGELVQREALCIDHATGRIIVTTEQIPAPIYVLEPSSSPTT